MNSVVTCSFRYVTERNNVSCYDVYHDFEYV